jgi:hypothetical protein
MGLGGGGGAAAFAAAFAEAEEALRFMKRCSVENSGGRSDAHGRADEAGATRAGLRHRDGVAAYAALHANE